ncbi:MAG: ABC transporter substrate-binding protein [Oscillospiraceae bacterium]|nr:ABC transporter substrate-binding protein [Oscillospiraceae bacterium]
MKKLLSLLLAAAMTLSLAACGAANTQSAGTSPTDADDATASYKVGIVNYVDDASLNQIVENVESQLDAKAAELGVTFQYADYYANAQADSAVLSQIAADLIADEVDVIVAIATPVAVLMQSATEDNEIPVVFAAVSDPVGAGLVASMEQPGGNVTGTSDFLDTESILKLMLAADPNCDKVGLLYDTAQDSSAQPIADAKAFLDAKGIAYTEKTGSTTDEVVLAAQALIDEGVDAVFTPTDNTIMIAELSIYERFEQAGIAHYCGANSFALNGAFCGYGVDYANLGKVTGDMVAELLTGGKTPAEIPVQTFDNGIATVNTETCAALGFDLDAIKEAFAPLATQIVEIQTAESFGE